MTTPDSDDPILTTREAAKLLGVAVSTAQVWMEGGDLPTWKTPGGHRRVRQSAVLHLVRQRAAQPPPPLAPEFLPDPAPDFPIPLDEARRLAALGASRLMDTIAEESFDRLTWLATHATGCPMALITLLSSERQWFKSRQGVDAVQTPRALAFCNHVLLGEAPFVVEDASNDPRFVDHPMVTGAPFIRFYAGYPVRDANGLTLGALCVLDSEPRRLRERELRALRELAAIAETEIRNRPPAVS